MMKNKKRLSDAAKNRARPAEHDVVSKEFEQSDITICICQRKMLQEEVYEHEQTLAKQR